MKTPPITKLILKSFRSFPSATLDFDNPLFIVGRNGSGKSNFADAFSFISEAMSSPLQAVFDRRGGLDKVRNRRSTKSHPTNLGLSIKFGASDDIDGGNFAFEVKAVENYGYEIVREQCQVMKKNGKMIWFDRVKNNWKSDPKDLKPALESSALALPLVGGDERFAPIFKALSAMRVYSIEPAKLREMQDPDSGVALKPDGCNAASVLQELLRKGDADLENAINGFLEAIVPGTKSVTPKKLGKKLSMSFTQKWGEKNRLNFEAFNMSDGTLRSLGLIMAVFQKPSPGVLVIEEPESSIHPGALGSILDLIRRASKFMQVVVTTHSPELLDNPWIKDNNLRIITWREGASYLSLPSEASRLAMQKHLMGAGELLRSNALHPVELFHDQNMFRQTEFFPKNA